MIRVLTGILALGMVVGMAAWLDPVLEAPTVRTPMTTYVVPADLPVGCVGWMEYQLGDPGEEEGGLAPGASDVVQIVLVPDGYTAEPIGSAFLSDASVGVQVERVGQGDLAGLAAETCVKPTTDLWLVGGSTRLGNSARLVLVNPSSVTAEVVATIFGPTGQVDQAVIVSMGARSSEWILLEGIAAELATLVVHVEADGAGTVAAIQDSRLDGFIPAGSEWVVGGAMPMTRLAIPGVGPSDPEGVDGPATVRLMAPQGATVSLTLIGPSGELPWPGAGNIRLEAGIPVDYNVPASPRSTVIVEADHPIVAAAITRRGRAPDEGFSGDLAHDIVWVAGQDPRAGSRLSAVIPPYMVSVVAYSDVQGVFRVRDALTGVVLVEQLMGAGTMVDVPIEVNPGTMVVIEGDVAWALLVEDQGFLTAVQPVDVHDDPVAVSVVPGSYVP
jgi:hypothetical protein